LNILTDVPPGFYQILQVNSETVPSVLAIPALDTMYPTQLNTSIKEKARRTVDIETWLRDERYRVSRGNVFFSSANQGSYPMRKRGLSSGLKRPVHAAFRVQD
jgi:hypothetical protein